ILIVNVEISNKNLNPEDPKSYCIIGDMATAVIVGKQNRPDGNSDRMGIVNSYFETYGEQALDVCIDLGSKHHPCAGINQKDWMFHMDGKKMVEGTMNAMSKFFLKFIPHLDTN